MPPAPSLFSRLGHEQIVPELVQLGRNEEAGLFFFYFHSTLERAVSAIFSFEISHLVFDRILLFVLFSSFFFFLISSPFFIAESTFPTKRWFRVLNKIREPNSVGIICLSSGRTHVSFQSDGFISCPLINRHFHCPVYARLALLNCTGCHREDRTVNLVELGR